MTGIEWKKKFGDKIYLILQENGLSQAEFASLIGCTQGTVSQWMNCDQAPSAFMIVNISYAFGIDYEDLIDFGERVEV